MNPSLLAIAGGLTALMLVIFLATDQQLDLTITAVVATGGIAALAVYFYGREEAREGFADDEYYDDDEEAEEEAAEGAEEAAEAMAEVEPAAAEEPPAGQLH